jgi:PIN domain nuclease of toxin-antitoxin system
MLISRVIKNLGVQVGPDVSLLAASMVWKHRDPFDRIIAATAITRGLTLVSADAAFNELTGVVKWPGLVW